MSPTVNIKVEFHSIQFDVFEPRFPRRVGALVKDRLYLQGVKYNASRSTIIGL